MNLSTEQLARMLDRDGTFSGTALDRNTLRRLDFNVARDVVRAAIAEGYVVPAPGPETTEDKRNG